MTPSRPCPICGASERRALHRQRFADGPLGEGYLVVVCRSCGAGFADEIPPKETLDRYYAEQSKYEYSHFGGAESLYDLRRFEAIVAQVEDRLPGREAAILDVGCGTGGLLSRLQARGYHRLLGVDPSAACAAAARAHYGIEAVAGTVSDLPRDPERFDLIFLVGVLEHLRDPAAAVKALGRRLTLAGTIYCAQPDVEAFAASTREPYQQFSIEHVNFFSRRTLANLFAVAGMAPVQTWRWMVEWREGVTDSVVSGLFQVSAGDVRGEFDPATEPALRGYLAQSAERDSTQLLPRLEAIVRNGRPVWIWGAGTLTRRLLATTDLGRANILGFVDSNPHLVGTVLAERLVMAPEALAGRGEDILIASFAFEREIVDQIRHRLKLTNRLITLSPANTATAAQAAKATQ
jgi:2-polyprenyl-3-methyl-5-hydroxy-6-metoxy-1,4-benzoquinol methylase